jgi:hypothetical protein
MQVTPGAGFPASQPVNGTRAETVSARADAPRLERGEVAPQKRVAPAAAPEAPAPRLTLPRGSLLDITV